MVAVAGARHAGGQDDLRAISGIILADRLKRLEQFGIIARSAYQERPVRYAYTLTTEGRQLQRVLGALADWGLENIAGTKKKLGPGSFVR